MFHTRSAAAVTIAASILYFAQSASATTVSQVDEAGFQAGAGLITFSEFAVGTVSPVYAPATYGGGVGFPTVSFSGFFLGQSLGGVCSGAPSGCVTGSPSGPIALDAASPAPFITGDGAVVTSPVLSGSPLFNGPISILFSTPQKGVGLLGGFFNAIGGTAITAYDSNGNELGSFANNQLGQQFLGLITNDGTSAIAGLLFHLVGPEPAGFAIDNVRFGVGGQVVGPSPVPLPGALPLMATALGLGWAIVRRRKSKSAAEG